MNRKISGYAFTAVAAMGLFASCSNDEMMPATDAQPAGKTVELTVTAGRDGDKLSRTALSPAGGDLGCVWSSGDELIVSTTDGVELGRLALTAGAGEASATFTGIIENAPDGKTDIVLTYLGTNPEAVAENNTYTIDYALQSGSVDALGEKDVLNLTTEADFSADEAIVSGVTLERKVAYGLFKVALPEGVAYNGQPITVSGDNLMTSAKVSLTGAVEYATPAAITVSAAGDGSFYLTVLPGEAIAPTFSVTIDETTYTAAPGERTWKAGEFVRTLNEEGNAEGIELTFTDPNAQPTVDETVVGPVFEVNDKKFRFTKANLAYNVPDKRWYLLEEQYSFLCKKGWAYANGNYYGAKENDIDLFGFGCTGLFFSYYNDRLQTPTQFNEQINAPEYFIETTLAAGQSVNATLQGYKYPTQNATCNEGYPGSNLVNGIQGFTMDWGVAYSQQQADGSNCFTLLSSEWTALKSAYFMCGATITDVPNHNTKKNGVYGCLIMGVSKADDAKTILTEAGATVATSIGDNLSFTGTNYQYFKYTDVTMTAEKFKALEAADKVVFLPEVGHTSVTVNSYTKTDGYYWTATAGQAYTSTIFRFDGDSTPKVFKLDSQCSRIFGCSVRLVKEVN